MTITEREFAVGRAGRVFNISQKEKALFPVANLVREEISSEPGRAHIQLARHQLAHLLFPEHFIQIVGATITTFGGKQPEVVLDRHGQSRYAYPARQRIYSVLARVTPDHATYTTHMGSMIEDAVGGTSGKKFDCDCEDCQRHHKVHNFITSLRAHLLARGFRRAGIEVDTHDSTDYCLTQEGRIIFFEIERVNTEETQRLLENNTLPPDIRKAAEEIVYNLEALQRDPLGSS